MALQLRRGTNAERLAITPAVGELIYVTDHVNASVQPLWVGDGSTPGGTSNSTSSNITYLTSITNTSVVPLTLDSQSTGTPAPGFGPSIVFQSETAPGNTERIGDINFILSDVTSGSEDAYVDIGVIFNGMPSYKVVELKPTTVKFSASDLTLDVNSTGTSNTIYANTNGTDSTLTWDKTNWTFGHSVVSNSNITATGDLAVNGGDITTTATTFNLLNTTATTLNIGGGATTALNIGAIAGKVIMPGVFLTNSSEDVSAGGTISLTTASSYFNTGSAISLSLAAGTNGQFKSLVCTGTGVGVAVVTVTNAGWKTSGTGTITFNVIGESCLLQYINSKWYAIGQNGVAFA